MAGGCEGGASAAAVDINGDICVLQKNDCCSKMLGVDRCHDKIDIDKQAR